MISNSIYSIRQSVRRNIIYLHVQIKQPNWQKFQKNFCAILKKLKSESAQTFYIALGHQYVSENVIKMGVIFEPLFRKKHGL